MRHNDELCILDNLSREGSEKNLKWLDAQSRDFRFENHGWTYNKFSGTAWKNVNDDERKNYLKNSYRVLLTRARQGVVIFIPEGDVNDATRKPEFYDGTFNYLKEIGLEEI